MNLQNGCSYGLLISKCESTSLCTSYAPVLCLVLLAHLIVLFLKSFGLTFLFQFVINNF